MLETRLCCYKCNQEVDIIQYDLEDDEIKTPSSTYVCNNKECTNYLKEALMAITLKFNILIKERISGRK